MPTPTPLRWDFTKGHGTENDFVLLPDPEGRLDLTAGLVRRLCDRRAGLGADGVLRLVRGRHVEGWAGDPEQWFMDYRNADGSLAQMCGNGARVFARYLGDRGLADGPEIAFGTRGGLRTAHLLTDGRVRVAMGPVQVFDDRPQVATADGRRFVALPADVGNPHAVCFVGGPDELAALPVGEPPRVPAGRFPEGVNVEFVDVVGEHHLTLRVHERGSGETRSCGTGTVAAAAATRVASGDRSPLPVTYRVDVPGGTVEVTLTRDQAYLTGPAVFVADGHVTLREE